MTRRTLEKQRANPALARFPSTLSQVRLRHSVLYYYCFIPLISIVGQFSVKGYT